MMCAILALSSCIHDEVYSSSDPASTEYTNKTLWEQDEKYIKNVMTVYLENEKDIRKSNGVPFWDYATTVNNFDEIFLMVPVVENKRVVSVLQVPRKGSKIHFYYSKISEQISFFQGLIFAKHTKAVFSENADANKAIICSTQTIAVWLPNDENDPDPESGNGVWSPKSIVVCKEYLESCISIINEFGECDGGGGDDNEDPGYDYPGEVEEPPQLPKPKDPCAKMKAQNTDQNYKDKVAELDKPEVFKKKTETGFAAAYGPQTNYESLKIVSDDALKMPVGNKYFGYIHVHLDKEGVIKIFSPGDISTFLTRCVRNAQQAGNVTDAYAMVITSQGNYILKYSGDGNYGIGPNQIANWKTWYDDIFRDLTENNTLTQPNIEKAFTQFLQKISIDGLDVYKTDKTTGNASKLSYNGKDNPVQSAPCP